jgi:hypothetical protein
LGEVVRSGKPETKAEEFGSIRDSKEIAAECFKSKLR